MPKTLAEIQGQTGGAFQLHTVEAGGVTYVYRMLKAREYRNMVAQFGNSQVNKDVAIAMAANEDLAKTACLSHTPQELDDIFERSNVDVFEDLGGAILKTAKEGFDARGKGASSSGPTPPTT